jgi:hypothetical protein
MTTNNAQMKRIIITLFSFSFFIMKTTGQQINIPSVFHDYPFTPQNLGLSTPQVSDFIKYGNLDVNSYNGLLNMEIELEGYNDSDFEIPISLKYISNGFVPTKRPSMLGNNWFLNFGGIITRTIYGSPDDNKGNYNGDNPRTYIKDGLLVAIRDGNFKNYSEIKLTNFEMDINKGGDKTPYVRGDFKYDFEPDIFKFSFGKHSGSFIIGNNGLLVSTCGDGYIIDISGLSIQEYSISGTPKESSITITTPDGYIYKFGGDTTFIEYSIPNNPNGSIYVRPRFITSWHLKSITSPHKRTVIFSYRSVLQKNKYSSFIYSYVSTFIKAFNCQVINPSRNSLFVKNMVMEDNNHTPVIEKIAFDNGVEITFDIQQTSSGFYENNDYLLYLSSISHKYNSTEVKKTSFDYLHSGKYFFLKSVSFNDKTYRFDYKLDKTLPDPMTTSVDHWGFWAGGYGITFANDSEIANYCINIENNRQVNTNVCDNTLLEKITYPNGGFTEVKYEYNRYN